MGIVAGTVSYLRFVSSDLPETFEVRFCDALNSHAFREIDAHSDVEIQRGWVRFDDAFEANFEPPTLVDNGGHMLFRLRIDTLRIPNTTLKAWTTREERERCAKLNREKLSKKERDQLKLEVKKKLRLRSLPKMQLVEVDWNVSTAEVRLAATSKAVAAQFIDAFEKTFEIKLDPVGLLKVLWLRGLKDEELDALARLEPERFHLIRR